MRGFDSQYAFADGETGLNVVSGSQVKVVNATFANNAEAGISGFGRSV